MWLDAELEPSLQNIACSPLKSLMQVSASTLTLVKQSVTCISACSCIFDNRALESLGCLACIAIYNNVCNYVLAIVGRRLVRRRKRERPMQAHHSRVCPSRRSLHSNSNMHSDSYAHRTFLIFVLLHIFSDMFQVYNYSLFLFWRF